MQLNFLKWPERRYKREELFEQSYLYWSQVGFSKG